MNELSITQSSEKKKKTNKPKIKKRARRFFNQHPAGAREGERCSDIVRGRWRREGRSCGVRRSRRRRQKKNMTFPITFKQYSTSIVDVPSMHPRPYPPRAEPKGQSDEAVQAEVDVFGARDLLARLDERDEADGHGDAHPDGLSDDPSHLLHRLPLAQFFLRVHRGLRSLGLAGLGLQDGARGDGRHRALLRAGGGHAQRCEDEGRGRHREHFSSSACACNAREVMWRLLVQYLVHYYYCTLYP